MDPKEKYLTMVKSLAVICCSAKLYFSLSLSTSKQAFSLLWWNSLQTQRMWGNTGKGEIENARPKKGHGISDLWDTRSKPNLLSRNLMELTLRNLSWRKAQRRRRLCSLGPHPPFTHGCLLYLQECSPNSCRQPCRKARLWNRCGSGRWKAKSWLQE